MDYSVSSHISLWDFSGKPQMHVSHKPPTNCSSSIWEEEYVWFEGRLTSVANHRKARTYLWMHRYHYYRWCGSGDGWNSTELCYNKNHITGSGWIYRLHNTRCENICVQSNSRTEGTSHCPWIGSRQEIFLLTTYAKGGKLCVRKVNCEEHHTHPNKNVIHVNKTGKNFE